MPKMQEHFSAGAWMAGHTGNEEQSSAMAAGMPKLHEHISAGGPEVSTSRPVDLRSSVLTR
jgi:hypothetical protein